MKKKKKKLILKSESVQENEMLGIIWDFEIQRDYLIPVRKPDPDF